MARAPLPLCRALLAAGLFALPACPLPGSNAGNTPCEKACHKSLDIHCSFEPLSDCVKGCEDTRAALESKPDYCRQAYDEYIGCLAAMQHPECGFKSLDPGECRPALDHYSNYCLHDFTPEEPCYDPPGFLSVVCADKPQRRPRVCRGNVESGCVMGGDSDFDSLYCCPGEPVGPDAGGPVDGGAQGLDAGATPDAGPALDSDGGFAGADAATPIDAGLRPDAGSRPDAGPRPDAGFFGDELRSCMLGMACGWYGVPEMQQHRTSYCAQWLLYRDVDDNDRKPAVTRKQLVTCGAPASGCEDFALCLNGHHDSAYCAAHPGGSCHGTVAVNCASSSAPAEYGIDCALTGNACELVDGKAHCLTSQTCPQVGACTSSSSYFLCDFTLGRAVGYTCTEGMECKALSPTSNASCVGTTACSGQQGCEGTVYVQCTGNDPLFWELRRDCSKMKGYACMPSGCAPDTAECTFSSAPDTCVGDVFHGCVAGRKVTYDCKAQGFSRCGDDGQGGKGCLY